MYVKPGLDGPSAMLRNDAATAAATINIKAPDGIADQVAKVKVTSGEPMSSTALVESLKDTMEILE